MGGWGNGDRESETFFGKSLGRRGAGRFGCVGVHNRLCPWDACLGNRGLRGFWRICGGLPPAGLPELERAKDTKWAQRRTKVFLGGPGIPHSLCVPPSEPLRVLAPSKQIGNPVGGSRPKSISFRESRGSRTRSGGYCVHNLSITPAARLAPGCGVSRGEMRRVSENDPAYRLKMSI